MKKILVILMIALMLATLCACSYVPATRFMSTVQVNSLAKKFDDPQVELTLDYTAKNGTKMQVVIVYKLLLTQTPLAVIRFVQLVNDGFYDNTFVDSYVSQYHYVTMGRYLYKPSTVQQNNPNAYFQNASEQTFKGEFKSNGYKEPKDGYAQFKILSLAMYHADYTEEDNNFDAANGYLIMALSANSLNSDNYAVFAEMNSVTIKRGDSEPVTYTNRAPDDFVQNLSNTDRDSKRVYKDVSEQDFSTISMMRIHVSVQFRLLGDYDWSKLPKVGK